jgi:hypothetical protein
MQLAPFGPDIWIAEGPRVRVLGPFTLPTRMIVVRLSDGSLWINSPIEASRAEMAEVERLGPVSALVAPAKLHRWRLPAWKTVFPTATTWEPPEIFTDEAPRSWAEDLDQAVFRGNAFFDEVEFVHSKSRTLIFNDFIQNHSLTRNLPGVPFDIRLTIVRKELARRSLRKLLSWDFDNLIVAHGDCVTGGAKALVESAFRFLA